MKQLIRSRFVVTVPGALLGSLGLILLSTACSGGGGSSKSTRSAPPVETRLSLQVQGPLGPLTEDDGVYSVQLQIGQSLATSISGLHEEGLGQSLSVELSSGDPQLLGFTDSLPIEIQSDVIDPVVTIGGSDVALAAGTVAFSITSIDSVDAEDALVRTLEVEVTPLPPGSPVGEWNFFREGDACGAHEFDSFPMNVGQLPDDSF